MTTNTAEIPRIKVKNPIRIRVMQECVDLVCGNECPPGPVKYDADGGYWYHTDGKMRLPCPASAIRDQVQKEGE